MKILVSILLVTCACLRAHAQVTIIETIAGRDTAGYNGDNIPATSAKLYVPGFICLDKHEDIYVADCFNERIRKISLPSGIITTIAGSGIPGYNGENISATSIEMRVPEAVFVDTIGNLFIADALNYIVRKVDAITGLVSTIAGDTTDGSSGDGGPATNAKLGGPIGLCMDRSGNIFIGDYYNGKVRKVDASGIITTFAGTGGAGYSGDNGPATDAKFNGPGQVYSDSIGNIYVCDQWNHVIRKIDITTNIITTIAGNGTAGHTGDGGLAISAQLNQPAGIDMDKHGNIFVAEYGNGDIRMIDGGTSIISTVAGNDTLGFSGDGGPATSAELRCSDVRVDAYGTLYIADIDNNRIRKVYNPKLAVPSEIPRNGEIKLFPNPAADELHIVYDFGGKDGFLEIIDLTGRPIITALLRASKHLAEIDIRNLPQGIFIYKVFQGDQLNSTGKILKN